MCQSVHKPRQGFTLAELLIALAILGVIATFTIPKVLDASTNSKLTAVAKEAASMISGSYQSYKANATPQAATTAGVLTAYWNYTRVETVDTSVGYPAWEDGLDSCAAAATPCYEIHNGAYVQFNTTNTFGGTNATNALFYNVDPDGDKNGAGVVSFVLYYNGRLSTGHNLDPSFATGGTPITSYDPDPVWMTWN